MPVTSKDVANQALQYIGGNQPLITGNAPNFDTSTAGKAFAQFYTPCVQTVARQWEWDFARNTVALSLTGNAAPFPWALEYSYPPNGVEIWQVAPASVVDPNNPVPTTWEVANAVVGGVQKRVIHTNIANAICIYNNNPNEDTWDALFREAVVRLLASVVAMAIAGKPDIAQSYLESGGAFETIGEMRDS